MNRITYTIILLLAAVSWCAPAAANDGGISFGGTPRLLSGHPSVSMESERIEMTVGEKLVTVDCRFVFRNHGPACAVRMGFPDQGEGANDPDEEAADDFTKRPPVSLFKSFRSWVDGQPVTTKLIRSDESGLFWHAKIVRFPANGAHVVRDRYTVPVGGGAVGGSATGAATYGSETFYTLHTGSSWHGPIGRTVVTVRFRRKRMLAPYVAVPFKAEGKFAAGPDAIYYKGPCAPRVDGESITFERTAWRPKESDDVYLVFGTGPAP